MCVELPSQVVSIKGDMAKVKQGHHLSWVDMSHFKENIKPGDYIISYQKVVINKVEKAEVEKLIDLVGRSLDNH